ncbi:MAG TPA: hypothetical protein DDZ81_14375 [Acetobacteraceae bacterium]|nr:hypothetical protein [Acetobacteraceae bacterium]
MSRKCCAVTDPLPTGTFFVPTSVTVGLINRPSSVLMNGASSIARSQCVPGSDLGGAT